MHEKIEFKFAFIRLSWGFNCFLTEVSGLILSIVFFEYPFHARKRIDDTENTYQKCVAISAECNTCDAAHVLHGWFILIISIDCANICLHVEQNCLRWRIEEIYLGVTGTKLCNSV